MRRFIASLPGKMLSHVVITALLVPYLALGLSVKGYAQLKQLPGWAVVDFVNKKADSTPAFGTEAAKAVANSLSKTGKYDVQTPETVARIVESLNLVQPLPGVQNVIRVGNELKVQTIVSGEVVDYRVDKTAAGKQARVSMRVVAYDVASQLPVNGAAVSASSIVRSGDVSDEVLINDAISQAAQVAVDRINQQTLPTATVLNTVGDMAIVNQGTRAGFKNGMQVIITRGRQQVASGSISDVSPDKSTMRLSRSFLGITPGDKVRAIFDVPVLAPGLTAGGNAVLSKPRASRPSNGVVTTLLVLGVVAFLVGGAGGRDGNVTSQVVAEAMIDPTNGAAIALSWKPNAFAKGNNVRQTWQIFRSDIFDVPVRKVAGSLSQGLDLTTSAGTVTYTNLAPNNFEICNATVNNASSAAVPGITVGRPYQYQVQLVFALLQSDLPGGGNAGGNTGGLTAGGTTGLTAGGTTGATAGGTTGATTGATTTTGLTAGGTTTGTTGATTTGTTATTASSTSGITAGGTSGALCYFVSSKENAIGLATAFNRPVLVAPASNATLQSPQSFTFQSVVNPQFIDVTVEYVIQVSSTLNFSKGTYTQRVIGQRRDQGTLATDPIDLNDPTLASSILNARTLYWRIGARNVADNPGPQKDAFTGERYIFSVTNQLTRPGSPPPPPSL